MKAKEERSGKEEKEFQWSGLGFLREKSNGQNKVYDEKINILRKVTIMINNSKKRSIKIINPWKDKSGSTIQGKNQLGSSIHEKNKSGSIIQRKIN